MRKTVPGVLKDLLKRSGLTYAAAAEQSGYRGASGVQRYFSDVDFPADGYLSLKVARKLAKGMAGYGDPPIAESEIFALTGPGGGLGDTVPLIDLVKAGAWGDVNDPLPQGEHPQIAVSSNVGEHAFALRVDGKSMMELYRHGDIVIVDPGIRPEPGDDVIAKLDSVERSTFKRYRQKTQEEVELRALNPDYEMLTMNAENPGHIVGVVVEHHRFRSGR